MVATDHFYDKLGFSQGRAEKGSGVPGLQQEQ